MLELKKRSKKILRTMDKDFFKTWSADMAYVLGYIAADGALTVGKRGNHYLDLQSIDRELILSVRDALRSDHKISLLRRRGHSQEVFRLQIGSKGMIRDLQALGLGQNKEFRLALPPVPNLFFGDFARGFFDGDGNVCLASFRRKNLSQSLGRFISVTFTCGSFQFLQSFKAALSIVTGMETGTLSRVDNYARLTYYRQNDIKRFFGLFYGKKPRYYLKRKFSYFQNALESMGR